jgi:serine/threonine protein kinase
VCRFQQDIGEKYILGKVLGKGQFGTTRIAIHKETGEKFACKTISKRKIVKQQVCMNVVLTVRKFLPCKKEADVAHGRL